MAIKLVILLFCALFQNLLGAATVTKVEGIDGRIQFIESASNRISYVVTQTDNWNWQSLYCLFSNDSVSLVENHLYSVLAIILNGRNELYAFDVNDNSKINIWKWNYTSSVFSNMYTYNWDDDRAFGSFFDNDDNLYFNSETGISILKYNDPYGEPVNITRLNGYAIKNAYTHAVDQDGTVYIGVYDTSGKHAFVRILKEEIDRPDPYPDFIDNAIQPDLEGLSHMTTFSGNVIVETESELLRFADDSFFRIVTSFRNGNDALYSFDDVLYFQRAPYPAPFGKQCYAAYVDPNYEVHDIEDMTEDCNYYQTYDSEGNTYVGRKMDSKIYYFNRNETEKRELEVPNALTVFGMTASENGDVWLLAYNMYVVPRGSTAAIKIPDSPHIHVTRERPMKARKNTNQVLVGTDAGLFVAEA